jgi:hypothetical protein
VTKDNEIEVLFPEAKVGDITIKPWSFGKLFDVSGLLEKVLEEVENKGLTDIFDSDFVSYISIAKLFTIASDPLLKIMAITLYKDEDSEFSLEESVKKVRKFDMDTGVRIAIAIGKQNISTIKNALAPLLESLSNQVEGEKIE